jgi:hypothetical protein
MKYKKKIYDFIIIGSGPAGSILASNLAKKNYKIAIIDRATNVQDKSNKNQYIYSPYVNNCPNYYSPIFSNQLGGNSALWNNKIFLISKDEFLSSKWSFSYKELFKFSKELAVNFKISHDDICKIEKKGKFKFSNSIREKSLGNLFYTLKINKNKNIKVYDHSSPTKIIFDKSKKTSKSLIVKNIKENKNFEIHLGKGLIFCAGGIGNPNLIKNLFKKYPRLVGKNLCDHSHINFSNIKIDQAKKNFRFAKYFIVSSKNKKEQNLFIKKNSYFTGVQLDYIADPSLILRRLYIRTRSLISLKILLFMLKYKKLLTHLFFRIAYIMNMKGKYSYEFFFSQKLNVKNCVDLDNKIKDEFGLFKSNIIWNINDRERKKYQQNINSLFDKKGGLYSNNSHNWFDKKKIFVGLHPSCTTISSSNKKKSCVDNNLRLKGYNNTFICGSSIFSGNGFTNPTWTIMTLSLRLAKYLSKIYN